MRGQSSVHGACESGDSAGGPGGYKSWLSGYQVTLPDVTIYTLAESDRYS